MRECAPIGVRSDSYYILYVVVREIADAYEVELSHHAPDSDLLVTPTRRTVNFDTTVLLAKQPDHAEYGSMLTQQLFADQALKEHFLMAEAAAEKTSCSMRLMLHIDESANELNALRWELLCHPTKTTVSLGTSERVLLSRVMTSRAWRGVELRARAMLRALIAVAAPGAESLARMQLAEVDFEGEVGRAKAALAGIETRSAGGPKSPLTLDFLIDELRDGADVLYLVCHGRFSRSSNASALILQDGAGNAATVDSEHFAQRLAELQRLPRLVVLASCESAGDDHHTVKGTTVEATLAVHLANAGVPAVIAMQGKISMDSVELMMPTLFSELLRDGQIDRAMAVARGRIRDRSDWWVPVLYSRLRGGRLWDEGGVHASLGENSHFSVGGGVNDSVAPPVGPSPLSGIPVLLIDQEIRAELDRLVKFRYLKEYSVHEVAVGLAYRVMHDDLRYGTGAQRRLALAWCARVLATKEHLEKAKQVYGAAVQLGGSAETNIAQASIYSAEGRSQDALALLSPIGSSAAQAASIAVVRDTETPIAALEWFGKAGLQFEQLDSDGKQVILSAQLDASRWDDAFLSAKLCSAGDFQERPTILLFSAYSYLMQVVADSLRSAVWDSIPLRSQDFPLAGDFLSLKCRKQAESLFSDFADSMLVNGFARSSHSASDYALWLRLRDPETSDSARDDLRSSMRSDPELRLRRFPLAVDFGVDINFQDVEQDIERLETLSGGPSSTTCIARYYTILAKDNARDAASDIRRYWKSMVCHISEATLTAAEIEALARSGQVEQAKRVLVEQDVLSDEMRLELEALVSQQEDTIVSMRIAKFHASENVSDLAELVRLLRAREDWSGVADYEEQLFDKTHSLEILVNCAKALARCGKWRRLFRLLYENDAFIKQSEVLRNLWLRCLYCQGSFPDCWEHLRAIEVSGKLNDSLAINLAIASGRWESLISLVEREWENRESRSASELIYAAKIGQAVKSPRTKQLIVEAVARAPDDPGVLLSGYSIACSAGIEDESEVSGWLRKAAELSDETGPVRKILFRDILAPDPEWEKRQSQAERHFLEGTAPLAIISQLAGRSLLDIVLMSSLLNEEEADVRRRALIPAFSGAVLSRFPEFKVGKVVFEPTSVLTLGRLGLLEKTIESVGCCWVAHSTLIWLFNELQRIRFHQPSRMRDAHELRDLVATGKVEVLESTAMPSSSLAAEVGESVAGLLLEARHRQVKGAANGKGKACYVVASFPIYRIGSAMEKVADVSEFDDVLISCQSVADRLKDLGKIGELQYRHATSFFRLQSRTWPNEKRIREEAVLYLDAGAVSLLQHVGCLSKLQGAGFVTIVLKREMDDANSLISLERLGGTAERIVYGIKDAILKGVLSGSVKFGASAVGVDELEEEPSIENLVSREWLEMMEDADVIVSDDRYFNQHGSVEGRKVEFCSTLGVLDMLRRSKVVGPDEWLECRTRLRQWGYSHVPVLAEELDAHIVSSGCELEKLVESIGLRAIRESADKIRMTSALNLPREQTWFRLYIRALLDVLSMYWSHEEDEARRHVASLWIVRQLDIRCWAHLSFLEPDDDLLQLDASAWELPLRVLEHVGVDGGSFLEWFDEHVLACEIDFDPARYNRAVERILLRMKEAILSGEENAHG